MTYVKTTVRLCTPSEIVEERGCPRFQRKRIMLRKQYSTHVGATYFIVLLSSLLVALLGADPAQAQTYTVLHAFAAGTDGADPNPIIRDSQGNLYGTTKFGGIISCGQDSCG